MQQIAVRAHLELFLRRLLRHSVLSDADRDAALALPGEEVRIARRCELDMPDWARDTALLVADGLVARFDALCNGSRQITALYLPGDAADLGGVVAPVPAWGLAVLVPSTLVRVPHSALRKLAAERPGLAAAFWRDTVLDAVVLAKAVANVGRRNAHARVAHFLCEMGLRFEMARRGDRCRFRLEMTQEQIGDALGLTAVHVNRTLGLLRQQGLLVTRERALEILDWQRMAAVAEFDPGFLTIAAPDAA